jgi:hypothetical protein
MTQAYSIKLKVETLKVFAVTEEVLFNGHLYKTPEALWAALFHEDVLNKVFAKQSTPQVFHQEPAVAEALQVTKCPPMVAKGAEGRTRFQDLAHRLAKPKGKPSFQGISLSDLDIEDV